MRLRQFANKYNLSLESLQYLIHDFGIDLNFCFNQEFKISEAFEAFVVKHLDFIRKYAEDKAKLKSINEIAAVIDMDPEQVAAFFKQNGVAEAELPKIRTNISSFQIDMLLGSDYNFIFQDIPKHRFKTGSLVGYSDLFFYCLDMLDPFINEDQNKLWGISRPGGMILYGPPGAGKIFWAKRIADIIGYEFVHVYKDYLLNTNGADNVQFNNFLRQQLDKPRTLLFIENFEALWDKVSKPYASSDTMELVNTIFRFLQKDGNQELVLVGAVESLGILSDEVTAPGRFDLHLPIFPPSVDERAQLLHYHLTHDLAEHSPLLAILKANEADSPAYWMPVAAEMRLFSNTMLIDFTQALKKRLYAIYRRRNELEVKLTLQIMQACLNETRAKLTKDYLERCQVFIQEAKHNVALEFPQRFLEMEYEFSSYAKKEEPIPRIGFETSAVRESKANNGAAPES